MINYSPFNVAIRLGIVTVWRFIHFSEAAKLKNEYVFWTMI